METTETTFVPNHLREADVAILVITSNTCVCNVCGQEALPNEDYHHSVPVNGMIVLTNNPLENKGCGAKFIATTSPHDGVHGKNAAKRIKPTLPFVDAHLKR